MQPLGLLRAALSVSCALPASCWELGRSHNRSCLSGTFFISRCDDATSQRLHGFLECSNQTGSSMATNESLDRSVPKCPDSTVRNAHQLELSWPLLQAGKSKKHTHTHTHPCIKTHTHMYMCIYLHTYTYVYVCVYKHTHTYIYI